MSVLWSSIAVLLLVLGNAYFVAAEYSLVTARRSRLVELAELGSRRARLAVRLLDDPVRFIATSQLGVTAFSILIGAVGEPIIAQLFDPWLARGVSFVIAILIVTYLHVVLGELVPKALALATREKLVLWLVVPLEGFYIATKPVIWIMQKSADQIIRLFGVDPRDPTAQSHTEHEIRMLVAQAPEIEEAEQELIYKAFDFADKEVAEVMVPRPDVVAISVDMPPEEALAAVIDSPFTRYPVYRETIDEIIGILHVRDLFKALYGSGIENVKIEEILRPAYVVPETKDLAALLAEFRKTNQHLAVVVDEYGSTEGIVTLENVLEEIVGEIEDEYDLPDEEVERLDDHRILVDGTFPIDDFNEQFRQELPQEDYHTVAGFVFGELGRAAETGDEVLWDGLRFAVVETEGPRIEKLEIEFLDGNGHGVEEPVEQTG
ncbi:MAG TPA: hemolysin family protein [Gaiellaceae bacterium]|nr:hemolysin family protein [Gaiellaceae bacterium]